MNSHKTAIKRNRLSLPMRIIVQSLMLENKYILDFGCGKGDDHRILREMGYCIDKYDKYHHPKFPKRKYDIITCHYVLNTIVAEEQVEVIDQIKSLLLPNGVAFITVRRDLDKDHKITSIGTLQRNVVLEYKTFKKNSSLEIYEMKNELRHDDNN